jgi:hypothetical protein
VDPAVLEGVLRQAVAASPAAVLVLPLPDGAAVPTEVAGRLETVGRLLGTAGPLAMAGVTISHDIRAVSVDGRCAVAGLNDLAAHLSVGPGDSFTFTATLDPTTPGGLHPALKWTALWPFRLRTATAT